MLIVLEKFACGDLEPIDFCRQRLHRNTVQFFPGVVEHFSADHIAEKVVFQRNESVVRSVEQTQDDSLFVDSEVG